MTKVIAKWGFDFYKLQITSIGWTFYKKIPMFKVKLNSFNFD